MQRQVTYNTNEPAEQDDPVTQQAEFFSPSERQWLARVHRWFQIARGQTPKDSITSVEVRAWRM